MALFIYLALGYWACGKTWYRNKVRIGSWDKLFLTRLCTGMFTGFVIIPIAIVITIMEIIGRSN